jgi:hypothetical protein
LYDSDDVVLVALTDQPAGRLRPSRQLDAVAEAAENVLAGLDELTT